MLGETAAPTRGDARQNGAEDMVFYGIVIVAFIGFVVWFVRTPTFRHHRQGRGKNPGQEAGHAMPYLDNSSAYFRKND